MEPNMDSMPPQQNEYSPQPTSPTPDLNPNPISYTSNTLESTPPTPNINTNIVSYTSNTLQSTPPTTSSDAYPLQLNVEFPEKQSRVLAFFSLPYFLIRFILLIPQFIAIYVIMIIALFAAWFNQFAILFTGHSSKGLHDFVVGLIRWNARISAYSYGLTDKYPPFSMH